MNEFSFHLVENVPVFFPEIQLICSTKKTTTKNKDNSPKNIPSAKINKQPYNDPNKYTFV